MQKASHDIAIFLVVVSTLILLLVAFIISMLYLYKKRQSLFFQNLEQIKLDHEKQLLSTQLEMQELTFQHISREIHDNINLSLTLAKLQLNTLNHNKLNDWPVKVSSTIDLLSRSIHDLSDISRSLNADIIIQHGLIKALEDEVERISQAGNLAINFELTGTPFYLEAQKELIIFRIVQEAFNNIIRHAYAKTAQLTLHYEHNFIHVSVCDNGIGFHKSSLTENPKKGTGLGNMRSRMRMIKGTMQLITEPGLGTSISLFIPIENEQRKNG